MMNALRRSVSGWTAKFLLGLLVISFAVWGIADVFRTVSPSTVVTAGETEVSLQDYAIAYNQATARLAQQLQRQPTREEAAMFGIDQQVLGQLTAGAVLDEQARRIGLGLSQDRLAQLIAEDPAFQDASGNFSRNAFRQLLAGAGFSEEDYIRNREQAAKRIQLVEAVSEGVAAPAVFQTALGLYNGERRTVEYVTLGPDLVQPVPEPGEGALQAFFEENKADYAAPEYRSIAYAVLTPEAIADPSTISDEQVAADYEANPQRYTTPEQRRVQQIIYPDAETANAALAKLEGGATFETLAADSGRTVADTDLGLLTREEIPDPAIADAAFALEAGEVSDVVSGAFGPAILRVTEIQPETTQPLDAVQEEIRQELALVAANETTLQAYETFEDARAGGATLEEAAGQAGLTVETIAAVDRSGEGPDGEPVADIPGEQELVEAAFETDPGLDNPPINFQSNGYVFYDVKSIDPARERTFDEVRERVLADWKASETQRLLGERVAALKSELEAGKSLDQIAAEAGLEKSVAPSITRQTGPSAIGQAATSAAFSGESGTVATAAAPDGTSQLLLKVTEVAPPADPRANVPDAQRQQISAMLQNDLLQSYIAVLQGNYGYNVHPAAIEQAKALAR